MHMRGMAPVMVLGVMVLASGLIFLVALLATRDWGNDAPQEKNAGALESEEKQPGAREQSPAPTPPPEPKQEETQATTPKAVESAPPTPVAFEPTEPDGWECVPTAADKSLKLNSFYKKACVVKDIPIVSSQAVSDKALVQAAAIMKGMLSERPDIVEELAEQKLTVAIIGTNEVTTDVPEYAYLKSDTQTDWDARARGFGATTFLRLSSAGEENLLCLSSDRYVGESIFVHEFAHSVENLGLTFAESGFSSRLTKAYQGAMAGGLWANTYAATNEEEYFAEGVQSYFDTNISATPTNGIHNSISTREKLKAYDPALYELIEDAFPTPWRYRCGL